MSRPAREELVEAIHHFGTFMRELRDGLRDGPTLAPAQRASYWTRLTNAVNSIDALEARERENAPPSWHRAKNSHTSSCQFRGMSLWVVRHREALSDAAKKGLHFRWSVEFREGGNYRIENGYAATREDAQKGAEACATRSADNGSRPPLDRIDLNDVVQLPADAPLATVYLHRTEEDAQTFLEELNANRGHFVLKVRQPALP